VAEIGDVVVGDGRDRSLLPSPNHHPQQKIKSLSESIVKFFVRDLPFDSLGSALQRRFYPSQAAWREVDANKTNG
jgi:hypothetical protein